MEGICFFLLRMGIPIIRRDTLENSTGSEENVTTFYGEDGQWLVTKILVFLPNEVFMRNKRGEKSEPSPF